MINVSPSTPNPTHHISLTDPTGVRIGLNVVNSRGDHDPSAITHAPTDRMALKTTSGNSQYSDMQWPWTPIAQEDWSEGRASEDFDKAVARYMDSKRANTIFGPIYLGPQETYTSGYRSANYSLPGSVSWIAMLDEGARKYLAVRFHASASYTAAVIALHIRRRGTPTTALTVELCADAAGNPGTVLQTATATTSTITDTVAEFHYISITAQALTGGVPYWVKVYAAGTTDDHWEVGVKAEAGTTKESSDDSSWGTSSVDLYYRVTAVDVAYTPRLFQYKNAMYCLLNPSSGAPSLYLNGDRGVADANTGELTLLKDATKAWTTDQWVGCVVYIRGGTGSNEPVPYRTITGNGATSLTVDTAWTITHDTTTDYVIIGANTWQLLASTGLTVPVTDVIVVNDIVYFAQGESVNIRRMQFNGSTGVHDYADDGTNKATHMTTVRDATAGLEVWRANNSANPTISKAPVVAWGTNLTFAATADTFKDDLGRITGLIEYGAEKQLWIFREGGVFYLDGGKAYEIPLMELHAMQAYTNGRARMVHNVYLYFNLGYGLERYYNSSLDDVGPNRDEGLPDGRQGVVSCLVAYPGRFFAGIDAGTGISSVLCYNEAGWHEVYRAPTAGQRVLAMAFQVTPGTMADRMWIVVGQDIIWLPFPSGTIYPYRDSAYRYTHEASVVSGWMYAGLVDVPKIFSRLRLFAENLIEDITQIEADYQLDNDTEWTPLASAFDFETDEVPLEEESGARGKRLRLRLRLMTSDNTETPRIKSCVVDAVSRDKPQYSTVFSFRAKDAEMNLNMELDEVRQAAAVRDQLLEWAENGTPLRMNCIYDILDDQLVFISAPTFSPIAQNSEEYIGRLEAIQL